MPIKAYVLLKVSSGTEREVCKKIADFSEVQDASIVYGEYDIIAKVMVDELTSLEDFLSENIRNIRDTRNEPCVMVTSTMIVAREYKGVEKRNSLKAKNT